MTLKITDLWYRWSIECGCHSPLHRLVIDYYKDDYNAGITFAMDGKTFKQRLQAAWVVLHDTYDYHQIILDDAGLEQLSAAIDSVKNMRRKESAG